MHQMPYHSGDIEKDEAFKTLETQYLKAVKSYSREELNKFAEMMALLLMAYGGMYGDLLGEIAGECEVLSKHAGQFFTPYAVSRLMAQSVFSHVRALVEQKGVITVCEPAVGAGGLVIASAEAIADQGVDPRAHVQFDCTDVSRNAFNMAYIQLSMLGLQAVVRHGDTLSMEIWESRPTPQLRLFDQWLRRRQHQKKRDRQMRALLGVFDQTVLGHSLVAADGVKQLVSSVVAPSANGVAASLFDTDEFAAAVEKAGRERRTTPDVLLDKQMSLFEI